MGVSLELFDADLRAELGSRWVRWSGVAMLGVGVTSAAAWLGGLGEGLWAPAVGCVFIGSSIWVRSRIRHVTPTWLVFSAAIVSVATAAFTPIEVVQGMAISVMVGGVTAVAVFESRRRAMGLAGLLVLLEGTAVWLAAPGWGVAVSFLPGIAGAAITVSFIATLRSRLAERGREVATGDARYRDLFNRVPVGLYRTGLGGELLDANQALADLLGAPLGAVVGHSIHRFLVDPADLKRLRDRVPEDGTPLVTDLHVRRLDGSVIWVRDRTRAVCDSSGEVVSFEGELQDITEQIEHVERLQALVKSKSDLIAAVSHELRTPLTAVVGYLDLIATGSLGRPEEMVAIAAEQAHEVAAIVDDLLTAARLDNRELLVTAKEVDVVGAVHSAVRSLGNASVLMSLPLQLTAIGDGARIRQILRNLIGNAYRYGAPPVSIHAEANGGTVSIVVADRGDPIGAGVESQMFEPFFTTGVGESQPGAIGLGLAVSRQLARRMGGDLRHDRVGAETRFTLELPVSASEVEAA